MNFFMNSLTITIIIVLNELQKTHNAADYVTKLMKWDKYAPQDIPCRVRSLSFDTEEIKEEPGDH